MSSRRKSNRQRYCPGCNVPTKQHDFGPLTRFCTGPPSDDGNKSHSDDEEVSPAHNNNLLQAIRSLAGQIESLQLDQQALRAQVNSTRTGGGSAQQTHASTFQPVQPGNDVSPLVSSLPYTDLLSLLPVSTTQPADAKDSKTLATIESFDHWLEASPL